MTEAPAHGAFETYDAFEHSEEAGQTGEASLAEERRDERGVPSLAERLRALEAFSAG